MPVRLPRGEVRTADGRRLTFGGCQGEAVGAASCSRETLCILSSLWAGPVVRTEGRSPDPLGPRCRHPSTVGFSLSHSNRHEGRKEKAEQDASLSVLAPEPGAQHTL